MKKSHEQTPRRLKDAEFYNPICDNDRSRSPAAWKRAMVVIAMAGAFSVLCMGLVIGAK